MSATGRADGDVPPVGVLVVDDDFAVAGIHRGYVDSLPGFVVVGEVHQGLDVVRAVVELEPDLVLLDIYLPDISGVEVLRRLRADPLTHDVDVIAITASREVETVRAAMTGGVVHYLIKPFTLSAFQERMRGYYAHHRELTLLARERAQIDDQAQVDRVLSGRPDAPVTASRTEPPDAESSRAHQPPKGLSALTLSLVERVLREADDDLSAAETARAAGLSRVSARRYLEHLVSAGRAEVRPRYGSAGRPEHGYRWRGPSR